MAIEVKAPAPQREVIGEKISRFDIHQRVQHIGLMVSFTVLALTGLPMKFNDMAVSQGWVSLLGGIDATRMIHRVFAWIIIAACVYHLCYLFYSHTILKKPFPVKMMPSRQDFIELFQEIGYFTGLRKEKPRFDRFNWREKFDYWAIFWGMPVMAGSGFILMYPVLVTNFAPGWVVTAALVAHSDEAMLALLWIFLVHIFFNHFSPGIFPMNTSIFSGKVSRERYRKDHPREYERLPVEREVENEQ